MWVMIEREREQKSELSDQIKRTNKLARTVMAMAEDEDEGQDDYLVDNFMDDLLSTTSEEDGIWID